MKAAGLTAAAGWIGWNVGTYLKDEFLVVEQAGIALAAGMTKLAERARFALEVLNTPVDGNTLDNINAAYDRMQLKLASIDDEYAALFESAGKAVEKQKEVGKAGEEAAKEIEVSAGLAATALDEVATAGDEVRKKVAAVSEAIGKASNTSDLEQLRDAMLQMADGEISSKTLAAGLAQIEERARQIAAAATEAGRALLHDMLGSIKVADHIQDFTDLRIAIRQMFLEGKISAEEFDKSMEQVQEGLDNFRQGVEAQGEGAASVFEQLQQQIGAAADGGALDRLALSIKAAFEAGKISASEYSALLRLIDQQHNQLASTFISFTHIVRNKYAEMSDAALSLFDAQMKTVHSFKTWFDVISDDRYNKVKAQFDAMASEVGQMTERLDAGAVSSYELAHAAQAAAHYGTLLGEEQLGPLRRALDDARSRMKSLRDEAQNTLADLQDELLQLQGNEDEVARRRLERRKAEIEAQLAEAQGGGDRETVARLQEALQTLDKIGKEEAKQRAARASEERTATRPAASTPASTQPATTPPSRPPILIKLQAGNDSATVYADDERDLVTVLSRAKLRST
jgi:hypothetical protein